MMMNRSHLKDSLVGGLKAAYLNDIRQSFNHKEAANDDSQDFCMSGDRQGSKQASQGKGAGVAHEYLGWIGVIPEETKAGGYGADGNNSQILRICHCIGHSTLMKSQTTNASQVETSPVITLPESNETISQKSHHGTAGTESIQTIGQIESIGPGGHQQVNPDNKQNSCSNLAQTLKINNQIFAEGNAGMGGWPGARRCRHQR